MNKLALSGCVGLAILWGASASADPVADFYKGKQLRIVVRTAAGTGYDLYSRLLARHIVKHLPGPPGTMIAVNMPGGGGIVATNYMGQVAPKDGTVLTMLNSGVVMDQAMQLSGSLKTDLTKFNWIGNLNSSNQLVATWHTSPTKTLEDAMQRETLIGTTGAGAIGVQLLAISNNVIGTKFKMIFGYSDMGEIDLAMERGELEGRATSPYSSYAASTSYIRDNSINFIIQFGVKKDPHVPDVPLALDLGKTPEAKAILQFVSASVAVGWPIATTPDVPKDRVAALRTAFDATLADPDFVREAEQSKAEINPMSGAEVGRVIHDVINAPADIRDKAKVAMQPKNAQQVADHDGPQEKTKDE